MKTSRAEPRSRGLTSASSTALPLLFTRESACRQPNAGMDRKPASASNSASHQIKPTSSSATSTVGPVGVSFTLYHSAPSAPEVRSARGEDPRYETHIVWPELQLRYCRCG